MADVLTVLVKEVKVKEGENTRGAYTMRMLIDGNDTLIGSTFGDELKGVEAGQKVDVAREKKGDYWNLTSVKKHVEEAETPALGTGEYVRGQASKTDARGMAASTALNAAVASLPPGANYGDYATRFHNFFLLLALKRGIATDDDHVDAVPFG